MVSQHKSLRITSPESALANRHSRESDSLANSDFDEAFVVIDHSDMTTSRSTNDLKTDWIDLDGRVKATQDLVASHSSHDLLSGHSTLHMKLPVTSISSQNLNCFDKGKEPHTGLTLDEFMSSLLSDLNMPIGSPRPSIDDECFDDEKMKITCIGTQNLLWGSIVLALVPAEGDRRATGLAQISLRKGLVIEPVSFAA